MSTTLSPSAAPAPASSRLRESALYEQVAERLRARILAHTLPPGSWIDEQALAAEFGISRTPLREALKVLAAEGLVTMKLRRGAYVTEVSERDLTEVYHLLGLLEADAAATVAEAATDAQLAELQALHDLLEKSVNDRDAFFRANEQFHLKLLQIADNQWTQAMVGDLRRVMKLNRHQSLFKQGRVEASLDEHRQIMQALKARDGARVKRLVERHIKQGREAATLS
ncbi:GntR family transcriptional regulator [Piscinibacter gummiphilus]|uniref:GntR family transcriptional regulator n=1 Tax=Piscinibacter gummiphilus TaxID=946333 RepID=A0ABZ0CNZ8_9BURK|nr:GntR family transcriptional regulator [Piscinibacter gummiphilus]WOB06712.1 GntR family transcriptional regulator [Piscinibacter gummiphilus]